MIASQRMLAHPASSLLTPHPVFQVDRTNGSGLKHLAHRSLDPLMAAADDQLHTPQPLAAQTAREIDPARLCQAASSPQWIPPKDSLSYRLRGNAYDNQGNREKAIEDWIQASRLGDAVVQSYLDFLGIKWREKPVP